MLYIVILLTFLFALTSISAVYFTLFKKEKYIEKLKYFDEDYQNKENLKNFKTNKSSPLKGLSNLIPSMQFNKKRRKKLEIELMKADIPITGEELLVIKILSSTALAFLAFALSKNLILVMSVFICIWNVPRFIIANKKNERIKQFDGQLNEGIMIISNSLKAGYSFFQATAVVAEETKAPFSKEFKKLLKEMSLGISEEDALRNLQTRMESGDLRLIINAILIQKDIGGNLSEILDNIDETIRERQKIQNELKTLTSQGKLSGIIVMLIPLVLGITIYLFNKEYILVFFNTSIGIAMLAASIFNQLLGLIMIRKIINIDM